MHEILAKISKFSIRCIFRYFKLLTIKLKEHFVFPSISQYFAITTIKLKIITLLQSWKWYVNGFFKKILPDQERKRSYIWMKYRFCHFLFFVLFLFVLFHVPIVNCVSVLSIRMDNTDTQLTMGTWNRMKRNKTKN
jgi:hypothetical protein